MTERCITMTREMALAALDGRKRVTRRVLNPQPVGGLSHFGWSKTGGVAWHDMAGKSHKLPMWTGDVMIVREPYWQMGRWVETNRKTSDGKPRMAFRPSGLPTFDPPSIPVFKGQSKKTGWYKRLARFMPAKHSRQRYKITHVAIEPIQEITEDECLAEGVIEYDGVIDIEPGHHGLGQEVKGLRYFVPGHHDEDYIKDCPEDAYGAFKDLWDSINADRGFGWDDNPWVVAYSFEAV